MKKVMVKMQVFKCKKKKEKKDCIKFNTKKTLKYGWSIAGLLK